MSEPVTLLVVGREWKFRALVRAELRGAGYEALGLETLDEAGDVISRSPVVPAALVLDLAESPDPESDLARAGSLARFLPVIVLAGSASLPEAAAVAEGVTLLRRPVSVADVVASVRERLEKPRS